VAHPSVGGTAPRRIISDAGHPVNIDLDLMEFPADDETH
jgi:hypothetical protein